MIVDGNEEEVIEDDNEQLEVDLEENESVETESDTEETEIEEDEESEESESDELIVTIGDEEPEVEEHEEAPKWVKDLRKQNRELKKQLKEKESNQSAEKSPAKLGDKPTLANCEYDDEAYSTKLEEWYETKRAVDQQNAENKKVQETQNQEWQGKLQTYAKSKDELKVKDFDEVEERVTESLDQTQQAVILQGAKDSALLIYALGKNKKKLKELADIKNPVNFAFAVANLEAQLKVTNKGKKPAPEKRLKATGGTSGVVDNTLNRLRAEAEKSGDYTKIRAYKKKLRNK